MKKTLVFVLAAVLVFSVLPFSVSAASSGNLANFTPTLSYADGTFTDVPATKWYFNAVKTAYTYGIISGIGNNKFGPDNKLTLVEALVIAAKIHAVYKYGADRAEAQINTTRWNSELADVSGKWYQKYVNYCGEEGLYKFTPSWAKNTGPITRSQMVLAWSKILSEADMPSQNNVYFLPDITGSSDNIKPILAFYRAGIISGTDANGSFNPSGTISRAEAAAIFMNLINVSSRAKGKTYGSNSDMELLGDVEFCKSLDTAGNKLTFGAEDAFLESMLKKSVGIAVSDDGQTVACSFTLVPLPEGTEWDMTISWGYENTDLHGDYHSSEPGAVIDDKFILTFEARDKLAYIILRAGIVGSKLNGPDTLMATYRPQKNEYVLAYNSDKDITSWRNMIFVPAEKAAQVIQELWASDIPVSEESETPAE